MGGPSLLMKYGYVQHLSAIELASAGIVIALGLLAGSCVDILVCK